ncbi:MAG: arylesterase [Betaproteobacteria bacterium]|jgi:acyl-CoA thioesterase I|nr:arylesterase [Betaproteobacteria bacterium]NBP43814.1 arylesterase [Betaproteobacteria bacterium]
MHRSFVNRRHFNGLLALAAWTLALPLQAVSPSSPRRLLVVGDSLSAEYGIAKDTGWVALLQQRLSQSKTPWQVINASISGDTTSGGRARLPRLLEQHQPHLVIIELGGNDALRGLALSASQDHLQAMIRASKAAGAKVLLVGMEMPPNYGPRYLREFREMYQRLAKAEKVPLVPFLLAGIADLPDASEWFQPDRIHPLAKAHPKMLDNVWRGLEPLL